MHNTRAVVFLLALQFFSFFRPTTALANVIDSQAYEGKSSVLFKHRSTVRDERNVRIWEQNSSAWNSTTWRTIVQVSVKVKRSRAPTNLYSNSISTFRLVHKLIYDIEVNPGPSPSAKRQSNSSKNTNGFTPALHCFYQNVRSIKSGNKLREFQDSVYANQFDIVAISETWLTGDISDSELLPWGYDIFRCDRGNARNSADPVRGGSVLLASRCNLRCKPVALICNGDCELEFAAIEVNTNNSGKVLVAVFYRPPSASANWIHDFIETLDTCTYSKMVLLGDFNFPSISWIEGSGFCDSSNSALFAFCQTLSDKNFFQLIDSPTRKDNCLDLLITTIVEGVNNIDVTGCEGVAVSSDHKAITFDLHFALHSVNCNKQPKFNLKKADFEGLRFALSSDPLESLFSGDDNINIEEDWASWKLAFLRRIEAFIPRRKPRQFTTPPWIDGETIHAIRKKNSLRKKALQKDSPSLWEKFRVLRKEVKYLIRSKRIAYLRDISDSCFSNPNRFWGYFSRLTRRSAVPDTVELNGCSYSSAKAKAEAFSKYFSSVFNADTSLPSDLPSSPFTNDTISSIELSNEDVLSALQSLNPSKTPGPDELHPRILKECANDLAPSLCMLFNKSLRLGKLPSDWKLANITPVFKKGGKSLISNYRQISLLSIVSKLCERCVLKKLLPDLVHLLSDLQHGFVQGRSCVTQLLSVLHDVGASLDAGEEIDVIYLDFSKAFDSVPHRRLLHKLSLFGIQGSLHEWFADYLTSRYQRVLVDGEFSPWVPVTSGVPQGSLLGPFLFLLHINDLPEVISRATTIALFADDAKCSRVVRSSEDCAVLQSDLNRLSDWSKQWGLSFNCSKCEVLRI